MLKNYCHPISDKQKEELSEVYKIAPSEKFEVIPLGFDLQRFQENNVAKRAEFRRQYRLTEDDVAIGIVGRLAPVKNHELFIRAIQQVKAKTNTPIKAFIIGDGELRDDLQGLCSSLGIDFQYAPNGNAKPSTITFTSWIKNIDTAYPGLDIVAMTSLNEGTPVSLIEAQAANKSIISTNVGGIENIVIPNGTALLTKNNCISDFSEKLLELVDNKELRESQASKGWEHVRNKFHYTRLVHDMEQLYYNLLNQHK